MQIPHSLQRLHYSASFSISHTRDGPYFPTVQFSSFSSEPIFLILFSLSFFLLGTEILFFASLLVERLRERICRVRLLASVCYTPQYFHQPSPTTHLFWSTFFASILWRANESCINFCWCIRKNGVRNTTCNFYLLGLFTNFFPSKLVRQNIILITLNTKDD